MRILLFLFASLLVSAETSANTNATMEVANECDRIELLRDEILALRTVIKDARILKLAPGYVKLQEQREQELLELERRCVTKKLAPRAKN